MMKRLYAGDETGSYCTKCRLDLNHVIVAMVRDKIVRVKCKTCGSEHKHRSTDDNSERQTGKTVLPKRKSRKLLTSQSLWENSIAVAKGIEIPYEMAGSYNEGNIIMHNIFGKGVVQKTHFKKCTVIFKDHERVLVSSNTK